MSTYNICFHGQILEISSSAKPSNVQLCISFDIEVKTSLRTNSADYTLTIFSLVFFFFRKQVLTFHANCLLCMKCQTYFLGKMS